jgi:hypothetical protein
VDAVFERVVALAVVVAFALRVDAAVRAALFVRVVPALSLDDAAAVFVAPAVTPFGAAFVAVGFGSLVSFC